MDRTHAVVVGSTNWDTCMHLPHLPVPGETVAGGRLQAGIGGKGANQAVACHRGGADVHFISAVGDDQTGAGILAEFQTMGLAVSGIKTVPACPTGVACIFIDARGENCIGLTAGANARLTPQTIEQYRELITSAGVVLLQLEIPLETVMSVAQIAAGAGVPVVLNPAPARALPDELLAVVDILTPNRGEAAALAGLYTGSEPGLAAAAKTFLDKGVGRVLVTLGADGAVLFQPKAGAGQAPATQRFAARAVTAVDTTGAGDVFNGVFCAGLVRGLSCEQAIEEAMVAAALAVTREGAIASIPTREEILAFRT
ncbi:ribokinase [Exilibacterium tricleocarpae]|uniref:Ribokinase n=1 Tax=Exilibacterium tricleocarpae TaxID=2591008 RepID=A0A545U9R2_9GAMM|nr:ribokinase [Exilibacterium tricleocarpae]TQV86214.1 ribokinase [Exilibacterium tricleocarpae]